MHKQIHAVPQLTPGVGRAGFPALLIDRGFISRADLAMAQQYAGRERVELADAFISLSLISERDCYATLAEAAGLDLVNASEMATSELAIRLVPERAATRSCRCASTTGPSRMRRASRSIRRSIAICRSRPDAA